MTSTRANDVLTMVVGTYTDTGSKGIYSLSFDQNTGTATFLDSLSMINPSYLTFGRDGRMLYAVSETSDIYATLTPSMQLQER